MKVGINGLGRIGRAALKILQDTPGLELAAINDLIPTDNLAYLLKYDTVYGRFPGEIDYDENHLIVNGNRIPVSDERDPAEIPWEENGVQLVFECTGVFVTKEAVKKHLEAGRVLSFSLPPLKTIWQQSFTVPARSTRRRISSPVPVAPRIVLRRLPR